MIWWLPLTHVFSVHRRHAPVIILGSSLFCVCFLKPSLNLLVKQHLYLRTLPCLIEMDGLPTQAKSSICAPNAIVSKPLHFSAKMYPPSLLHHQFFFLYRITFFLPTYKCIIKFLNLKNKNKLPIDHILPFNFWFFFSAPLYRKALKRTVCLCFVPSHFILNQLQLGSVPLFPPKLFLSHLYFASSLGLIWSALSEAFNTGPFPPFETLHLVFRTQSFCAFLFISLAACNQSCLMNLPYVPKCPKTHFWSSLSVLTSVSWIELSQMHLPVQVHLTSLHFSLNFRVHIFNFWVFLGLCLVPLSQVAQW